MGLLGMLSFGGPVLAKTSSPEKAQIVYPPCETQELVGFSVEGREKVIVSIAQFRRRKTMPHSFVRWQSCSRRTLSTEVTFGW